MDATTRSRLKKDLVVWLGTVGADGAPHATLVWFLWDGDTFLVYSVPGQKVRDISGNANVELHLNSDPVGSDMVRVSGTAKVVKNEPPADKVPAYIRKYREQIKGFGWTPQVFAERYHVAIRIRPTRFH